jgi:hypothetical protein
VDVDNRGIKRLRLNQTRADVSTQFAVVSRTDRAGFGHFTMRLALQTKADAVPAELIEEHMTFVEKVASNCNRALSLASGYPAPARPSGFGEQPLNLRPKPPFAPESKKSNEPLSPVVRHYSFMDKVRQHWRTIWIVFFIFVWVIIPMLLRGCSG